MMKIRRQVEDRMGKVAKVGKGKGNSNGMLTRTRINFEYSILLEAQAGATAAWG